MNDLGDNGEEIGTARGPLLELDATFDWGLELRVVPLDHLHWREGQSSPLDAE